MASHHEVRGPTFHAYQFVDMRINFDNPFYALSVEHHPSTASRSPGEIAVTGIDTFGRTWTVDLYSVVHHPFRFNHQGIVVRGEVGSILVDLNGVKDYWCTHLHTSVVVLAQDVREMFVNPDKGISWAYHDLFPGYPDHNVIKGYPGSFLAGSVGPDKFTFTHPNFGDQFITNFNVVKDTVGFPTSLVNGFQDFKAHLHIDAQGHVAFEYDALDVLTFLNLHHVNQLQNHNVDLFH